MAISAFPIIDKATTPVYTGDENILSADLIFGPNTSTNNKLGTPADTMREIQVQFLTSISGVLSVTFNGTSGTFFNLNNGDDILGLATFTLFVDDATELNFRFDTSGSIVLTVGG